MSIVGHVESLMHYAMSDSGTYNWDSLRLHSPVVKRNALNSPRRLDAVDYAGNSSLWMSPPLACTPPTSLTLCLS